MLVKAGGFCDLGEHGATTALSLAMDRMNCGVHPGSYHLPLQVLDALLDEVDPARREDIAPFA